MTGSPSRVPRARKRVSCGEASGPDLRPSYLRLKGKVNAFALGILPFRGKSAVTDGVPRSADRGVKPFILQEQASIESEVRAGVPKVERLGFTQPLCGFGSLALQIEQQPAHDMSVDQGAVFGERPFDLAVCFVEPVGDAEQLRVPDVPDGLRAAVLYGQMEVLAGLAPPPVPREEGVA